MDGRNIGWISYIGNVVAAVMLSHYLCIIFILLFLLLCFLFYYLLSLLSIVFTLTGRDFLTERTFS